MTVTPRALWVGFVVALVAAVAAGALVEAPGTFQFQEMFGFGALFELYSANFLMTHFWAVLLVLFAMAFSISEILAYLERRVAYYASSR